jgi:hypothetical protein
MSKVLTEIPEPLLKQVEGKAKYLHISRSAAVREALKSWIQTDDGIPPFQRPGMTELLGRLEKTRKKAPKTPSAESMIRKDRQALSW